MYGIQRKVQTELREVLLLFLWIILLQTAALTECFTTLLERICVLESASSVAIHINM